MISLTPGFSPVQSRESCVSRFNGLKRSGAPFAGRAALEEN
jgi:hypothetical protein